jgi:antitoxin component YwqK of YwqJK toxin-antitoxin module
MNRRLLTLLLLCSLAACESKRQELIDPEIVERDGLEFLARSTEPLTADVVRWHDNGQLAEQYTVIDGKKEGLHRWWFNTGQPEIEDNYVNGKKEGLSHYLTWDGQIVETNYVNGKREGLYRKWYENGQLEIERTYVNDECVAGCE